MGLEWKEDQALVPMDHDAIRKAVGLPPLTEYEWLRIVYFRHFGVSGPFSKPDTSGSSDKGE